ncbi:hypothetical protein C9374_006863 [Naegleria lovaniensis]|uniref:VWFA domain-containing protein n=1 Tax=Naegleria lovaniensis TaxID=51637 RepID=A0AA88H5T8_NAELO|nr:uncharacterized protein C9374_006863 [Naegleria lovaniensis]KAG2393332.1 hypothetical protein C9374_006863 [Naegleria lovaniensis]
MRFPDSTSSAPQQASRTLDDGSDHLAKAKKFIIFLLDGSSSLSADDFSRQRSVVLGLAKRFSNGKNQLAVIQFSSTVQVQCNATTNFDHVEHALSSMQQLSGSTRMDRGFDEAKILFETQELGPSRRIVIILTDGIPDDEAMAIRKSDYLKIVLDADVICLGVGAFVNEKVVKTLASSEDMGACVSKWDEVKDTIERLTGSKRSAKDGIRVSATILNRPVAIGQPVQFQLQLRNSTSNTIPKKSIFRFVGNEYFDFGRHVIAEDIEEDEKYKFTIELEPLDNRTIKDLEETLPYELLDSTKKHQLFKGAVNIWASDFCGDLITFKPIDVPLLNIGLFGTMGSGKSSFFNCIHTLLEGSVETNNQFSTPAIAGNTGDHVTTKMCRYNLPEMWKDHEQLSKLRYVLWDTFGLTNETYNNNEFTMFIEGKLPHEYEMTDEGQTSHRNSSRTVLTSPDKKIHSIIFVVAQGDRGDNQLMQKLKEMFKLAMKHSLQPLVVLSKIDEVPAEEDLEKLKANLAQQIGAPRHSIFTSENYHGETPKRRFDIDKNTYVILETALTRGVQYLKSLRNK